MIKKHASVYENSSLEKMLTECKYEQDKNVALKWFQDNVSMPDEDHRAGRVSTLLGHFVVRHSGNLVCSSAAVLSPSQARQLAGALLIAAERAEQE